MRLQRYLRSVNFQWVDKGQIGGHHFFAWTLELVRILCPFWLVLRIQNKKQLDSSNKTPMKIYTCYDNLSVQQWYYTNDKRIALQGQCRNIVDVNEKTG